MDLDNLVLCGKEEGIGIDEWVLDAESRSGGGLKVPLALSCNFLALI